MSRQLVLKVSIVIILKQRLEIGKQHWLWNIYFCLKSLSKIRPVFLQYRSVGSSQKLILYSLFCVQNAHFGVHNDDVRKNLCVHLPNSADWGLILRNGTCRRITLRNRTEATHVCFYDIYYCKCVTNIRWKCYKVGVLLKYSQKRSKVSIEGPS